MEVLERKLRVLNYQICYRIIVVINFIFSITHVESVLLLSLIQCKHMFVVVGNNLFIS
jgi:hypothetical protein